MTFAVPQLTIDPRKLPDDPAAWTPEQHDVFESWARDVRRAEIHRASHKPTVASPPHFGSSLSEITARARAAWAELRASTEAVEAFRGRVEAADARVEKARAAMSKASGASVLAAADEQQAATESQAAARRTFSDLEARHQDAVRAANRDVGALGAAARQVVNEQHHIGKLEKAIARGPGGTAGMPLVDLEAQLRTAQRKLAALLDGAKWPVMDGREENVVLVEDEHGHPQPWTVRDRPPRVHRLALTRALFGQLTELMRMGTLHRDDPFSHDPALPLAVRLADLEG